MNLEALIGRKVIAGGYIVGYFQDRGDVVLIVESPNHQLYRSTIEGVTLSEKGL